MKNESERTKVLTAYEAYLLASPDLLAALPELSGKVLACYCPASKRCHCDVVIEHFRRLVLGEA